MTEGMGRVFFFLHGGRTPTYSLGDTFGHTCQLVTCENLHTATHLKESIHTAHKSNTSEMTTVSVNIQVSERNHSAPEHGH